MFRATLAMFSVLILAAASAYSAETTVSAATADLARPSAQPEPKANVAGAAPATGPTERHPCPKTLSGVVNDAVFCLGETVRITGNTQVYGPGRLVLRGGTLIFDGPYSLDFYNGAEMSLDSSAVLLQQGQATGYSISTQSQALVNITGTQTNPTTITGAARVTIAAADARIDHLDYSGNASGLVITAAGGFVNRSRFFDNHDCGLRVTSSADRPMTVRNCESFASADTQEVGILLDCSRNASIDSNYLHHNSKAGIKLFVPYPEEPPNETLDVTPAPVPNALRVNRIEYNADGILEYTCTNIIENPGLVDHNTNHGFVGIDIPDQPEIQYIGLHNGAKSLYLASMRVGALVWAQNQHNLPQDTVFVSFCDEAQPDCDVVWTNCARHYDDYSINYLRFDGPLYFRSDLFATPDRLETFRGVETYFTPRFLVRDRTVDNSNATSRFCDDNEGCSIRAVTVYNAPDDYGRTSLPLQHTHGDSLDYYIFRKVGAANFALRFGLDDGGCGGREQRPDAQESLPLNRPSGK